MSDQEQQQPDGSGFAVDKENWGERGSPYDQDGFVRTEADRENERLGSFAADIVASKMKSGVGDYESDKSKALTSEAEYYENISAQVATAKDLEELRVRARDRLSESRRKGIADDDGVDYAEYMRYSDDKDKRSWVRTDEYARDGFRYYLDEYQQQKNSTMGQINELLELNKEGLTGLTVEQFVAVMDKRVVLKEKIAAIDTLIECCGYVVDDIGRRIEMRKMPYMLSDGQAALRGADDVMNSVAELYLDRPNKRWLGIFNSAEDTQGATDSLNRLLGVRFDISPREYLEQCTELVENMKTKAEAAQARLTQSLRELDERIKAGNFATESPESDRAGEKQTEEGERHL